MQSLIFSRYYITDLQTLQLDFWKEKDRRAVGWISYFINLISVELLPDGL